MNRYIAKTHRGKKVISRIDLVDRVDQYTLCSDCLHRFKADCPIYRDIETITGQHDTIVAVFACPRFMVKCIMQLRLLEDLGNNACGDIIDIVEVDGAKNLYYLDRLGILSHVKSADKGIKWEKIYK